MRHSIPRKVAHDIAMLWAGSQTKIGAAIHDEMKNGAVRFARPVHAFHLTADAANSKILIGDVEDRDACAG